MSKTRGIVELEKEDLTYLINYLAEDLRVWTEKGLMMRMKGNDSNG